jgi:hypothetical protein
MNQRDEKIKELITTALSNYMNKSPRSVQSAEGILGPSDIGFCRQKAKLMIEGVPQTDDPPKWAAAVGTALHNYIEAAIKKSHPDWLCGSIDEIEVTATLPSGVEVKGHPDIVVPSSNAVLDIKTVDGYEWIKRSGTSQQHKYQRHLYAMGLMQAGILDESKTVLVGNIYFDRSGKQYEPLVIVEEMDVTLTNEIDSWIQDVIYAVKHNEDASRDIPAPVCEKICSHFTACRGELGMEQETIMIENQELLSAVDMYVEGRDMAKQADQMKKEAQAMLNGINGSTGTYQVRWVSVAPTTVDSFEKVGYSRMDIRKVRK